MNRIFGIFRGFFVNFKSLFAKLKGSFANSKTKSAKTLQSKKPVRVLIFGSCVSRDIFEFAKQGEFEIVRYYARSSLASLSGEGFESNEISRVLSLMKDDFKKKCVLYDIKKDFWSFLRQNDFDILLLDFIDHRFNLAKDESKGGLVTISSEFKKPCDTLGISFKSQNIIPRFSDEFMALFKLGLNQLKENLATKECKIVLNKIFLTNKINQAGGGGIEMSIDKTFLHNTNTHLEKCYQIMQSNFKKLYVIEYENLSLDLKHKWGIGSMHYDEKIYKKALNFLRSM